MSYRSQFSIVLVAVISAFLGWVLYSQAGGLTWQFDDWHNLKNLNQVSDYSGLLNFVHGGNAGPTGRPLALLSFVPDYVHWPNNPWGMVKGNLLWHFLNAMLAFLLFSVLFRQVCESQQLSLILAVVASAFWALLPIHASGILMPVQRMTLVSAFFSLLTMVLYSNLRCYFVSRKSYGVVPVIVLSSTILIGTLLSVFSKENGALTILFIGLVEITFFKGKAIPCPRWLWRIGLSLLLCVVPVYIFYKGGQALGSALTGGESWRFFSFSERVASEPVILWEYLRQILLPDASLLGPMQDGHKVYTWADSIVWLSIAAILIAVSLSVFVLKGRRTLALRITGFAVLFYFGGHLIESTVISLELYFEHRNYMPSLGIAAAVVYLLYVGWQCRSLRLASVLTGLGGGAIALFALYQTTSLTGNPPLAAEMWHKNHPQSLRAAQALSGVYRKMGFASAAINELDEFANRAGGSSGLAIHALALACWSESQEEVKDRYRDVLGSIRSVKRVETIGMAVPLLAKQVQNKQCQPLDTTDIEVLLRVTLQENKKVQLSKRLRHYFYYELANIERERGNLSAELDYRIRSFYDYPSIELAKAIALRFFQTEQPQEAIHWLESAKPLLGRGYLASLGRRELTSMQSALNNITAQLEESVDD